MEKIQIYRILKILLTVCVIGSIINNNFMEGIGTMQNNYKFPQSNNYYVNPVVCHWKLGLAADGKILYCENFNFLRMKSD